jgi:hypothetical protein
LMYICLNARRDTGVLEMSQTELARNLKKTNGTIRRYLREIETAGICRGRFDRNPLGCGTVEVDPAYWPYRKPETEPHDHAADEYVSEVRGMIRARACVRQSFSTADEILARQWFERGVSLERIERAILTGCARKYVSWRNNQSVGSIGILRYFESVLEELAESPKVDPEYWVYLRSRIERMEKLWIESHTETVGECPSPPATTPSNVETAAGR